MQKRDGNLYNFNTMTVKRLGDYTIKICEVACSRIPGLELGTLEDDSRRFLLSDSTKGKKEHITGKFDNNIVRAKTKVKELVLCNDWDYWCTFTIAPEKIDRYDLNGYIKHMGEFIHNYNRRCDAVDKVSYLLVPERHKDGAWHMHGFIKGIRQSDLYKNKHGHLTWKQYEKKFGFISMEPLRSKEKASSYVLKYLTKDISRNVTEHGAHLYYASHGLKQPELIYRGHAELHAPWDYEHPDGYCKIKTIDTREVELSEILEVMP